MENYTDKFLFGLIEFFAWAKWLFFLALVLTLGDLKFGIEASRIQERPDQTIASCPAYNG